MNWLANVDPLFIHGTTGVVILIVLIKAIVGFAALMGAVTLMIWFERKAISDMQSRIGPQRWGPFGILQTLADGIKLFFKEDLIPAEADRFVFKLAPYLMLVPALVTFSIVPLGGTLTIAEHPVMLQIANPPMGILVMLAMSGISVYGVMLAGWASGSKYPLLSSVRASAQMISYEAALGITIVTIVLVTGSLSTHDIVTSQAHGIWHWNLFRLSVVPFVVFLIAITTELNRPALMWRRLKVSSSWAFTLNTSRHLLGRVHEHDLDVSDHCDALLRWGRGVGSAGCSAHIGLSNYVVRAKTVVFFVCYIWFRAGLPRFRYDQVMDPGWKKLIPLSLGWMLIVAGFLVAPTWGLVLTAAVLMASLVLARAFDLGSKRESGSDSIVPTIGQCPLPGQVLRSWSEEQEVDE